MSKGNILLVEDEKDIAENIGVRLQVEGYNTEFASNGKMGVDMALAGKYDLIFLDILLPKLNGFEVCKVLKSSEKTKTTPIVMLTSLISVGDVEKAFEAGADDYLTKPFEYERLLNKVKKFIVG